MFVQILSSTALYSWSTFAFVWFCQMPRSWLSTPWDRDRNPPAIGDPTAAVEKYRCKWERTIRMSKMSVQRDFARLEVMDLMNGQSSSTNRKWGVEPVQHWWALTGHFPNRTSHFKMTRWPSFWQFLAGFVALKMCGKKLKLKPSVLAAPNVPWHPNFKD